MQQCEINLKPNYYTILNTKLAEISEPPPKLSFIAIPARGPDDIASTHGHARCCPKHTQQQRLQCLDR